MSEKLFRWRQGRQDAKYDVLTFLRAALGRYGCDGHVIRYVGPVHLKPHVDPVDGKRHYRLNIIIGRKGRFDTAGAILNWRGRVVLFRPDKCLHGVTLESGRRYVLSIGIALP